MRPIGFSTGALAFADVQRGLELQAGTDADAVELSALREDELRPLLDLLPKLEPALARYRYVSVHLPSKLRRLSEADVVAAALTGLPARLPLVLHPDVVTDPAVWEPLGDRLTLENMDNRKPVGRTADELRPLMEALPEAGFCFDLAHARQVDSSMCTAQRLLWEFGDRLVELHLSELTPDARHVPLSMTAVRAFRRFAPALPPGIPVIVESVVPPDRVACELEQARRCFPKRLEAGRTGTPAALAPA